MYPCPRCKKLVTEAEPHLCSHGKYIIGIDLAVPNNWDISTLPTNITNQSLTIKLPPLKT